MVERACSPCACQIRCTEEMLYPTLAIMRAAQWGFPAGRIFGRQGDNPLDDPSLKQFAARAGLVAQQPAHVFPHEPLLPVLLSSRLPQEDHRRL